MDEALYETFNYEILFKNEVNAYVKLFPALDWCDRFPKYYYSHNVKGQAAIALADFTMDGWTMSKEAVNLSLDHILVAGINILISFKTNKNECKTK